MNDKTNLRLKISGPDAFDFCLASGPEEDSRLSVALLKLIRHPNRLRPNRPPLGLLFRHAERLVQMRIVKAGGNRGENAQ